MRAVQLNRRPRAAAWAAAAFAAAVGADAAVYRCDSVESGPRFSQFPCPNGEIVRLDPLDTLVIPPLSEGERRLLDELEQRRRTEQEERARQHARSAREAAERRDERRARCEAARIANAALARKRRKGYSAAEERALEREEARIDAELERNC